MGMMESWLNEDILRSMTPEKRAEYQRNLQRDLAQLAIYHEQLVRIRMEEGDYGKK